MINSPFYFVRQTFSDALDIVRSPKERLKGLYDVSLYRNSVFLIINSMALGLTGFVFWILAARLFLTQDVGVASAAMSAVLLISEISLVGLDYAIVRYLSGAGSSSKDMINSSLTITGVTSIIISLVFVVGLSFWSPELHPIREQPLFFISFVFFTLATNMYMLAQRICIAQRNSGITLAIGLTFGLFRFIPLILAAIYFSSSLGIFASLGIATFVSAIIGIFILIPKVDPSYHFSLTIRKDLLARMVRFALGNFVANVSLTVTSFILPLVVINVLGSEQNAYFYIAWTFSIILQSVTAAITLSLFAEGSNDPQRLKYYIEKSVKLMALIIIPSIVLTLLVGDKFLLIFGEDYSKNATYLLWLLVISAVPVGINNMYICIMRVGKEIKGIMAVALFVTIATLGASPYLLSRMGITGVGVAWLVSQGVVAIFTGRQILKIISEAPA